VRSSALCREKERESGMCWSGFPRPKARVVRAWKSAPRKKKAIAERACSQALGWFAGCWEAPRARMMVLPLRGSCQSIAISEVGVETGDEKGG
jgi:hypothetical protein